MNQSHIGATTTSRLGYGCMRFPTDEGGHIIQASMDALIRRAYEAGVTYFDTAWPYHNGESEPALRHALSPFPRDSYLLATKLPCWEILSSDMAVERLHQQLERLGTDYIDFYLLHALNRITWGKMVERGVVERLAELKEAGIIRNLGFSFHDSYETFEEILNYRQWDFCQIQLNYMDTQLQAGMRGYDLATARGVPLVIMEPLKGGMLAQLPQAVMEPLTQMDDAVSVASWGMRWLASLPNVKVILSGMSTMEQLEDNLATFEEARPLSQEEQEGVTEVTQRLQLRLKNGCTGCRYCLPCPAGVDIPQNFRVWNLKSVFGIKNEVRRVWEFMDEGERATHCVGCGKCLSLCPQGIAIPDQLKLVAAEIQEYLK